MRSDEEFLVGMARVACSAVGMLIILLAVFVGGMPPVMIAGGAALVGLPSVLRRFPSDPSRARPARLRTTHDNGDPLWWDAREKRWIGKAAGDADPYAEKLTVEAAFGGDPLAPYAARIAKWKRLHAAGVLTSEQLVERVERPEYNWTDPAEPGSRDERIAQLKAKHRKPRPPHEAYGRRTQHEAYDAMKDAETVAAIRAFKGPSPDKVERYMTIEEQAKKAELEALKAQIDMLHRAINDLRKPTSGPTNEGKTVMLQPGEFIMHLNPRTCESCAAVYTDQSTEPAARYCDGSCNR